MSETTRGVRILLVDDVVLNTNITSHQLKKLGYEAHVARDGREAVDACGRHDYDLVLMDCQMPEMDGYEATEEIRRREGPVRRTRIVAMTASAQEGDREKCLAAGMDDHVSKPVSAAMLATVVARWLAPPGD
jgi:CheY-like chemotaxis protein